MASTMACAGIFSSVRDMSVAVHTAPLSGIGPAGVMIVSPVTAMSPSESAIPRLDPALRSAGAGNPAGLSREAGGGAGLGSGSAAGGGAGAGSRNRAAAAAAEGRGLRVP